MSSSQRDDPTAVVHVLSWGCSSEQAEVRRSLDCCGPDHVFATVRQAVAAFDGSGPDAAYTAEEVKVIDRTGGMP
jgi:hypothetical protein